MKRKIMAVLLSAALVMSSTVVAFAETTTIEGGSNTTVRAGEGEVVNVEGNVNVPAGDNTNYCGVQATGGEVNVDGNVTGSEEGVVSNNGRVTVTGDVSAQNIGVLVESYSEDGNPGTVSVGGSVTGGGIVSDGEVSVGQNVTGPDNKPAITTNGDSKVVVGGNVTSSGAGIRTNGSALIIVEGTLTSDDSEPVVQVIEPTIWDDASGGPVPDPNAGPSTILVHEIKGNLDNLVKVGTVDYSYDPETGMSVETFNENNGSELISSQLDNIFYIIEKAADSVANILGLAGTEKKEGYDVAKAGTAVTVTAKEGYGITAGSITVTKNADGTYTLTVPQGGGVTLTAEQIQEAVQEAEQQEQQPEQPAAQPEQQPEQPAAQPEQQPEQPAAQPEQPAAQPEQPAAQPEQPAAPVGEDKKEEEHQSSSSTQDQNALWPTAGTVVLAGYDEATALDPAGDPAAYVSAFVDKIANTPQGGTAELFVTDAAYLDDTIVQALVARSDVAVKLNVTVNGQALVINIPAGYNLSRLIGKDGKISMKKLIELFVQKK